MNSTNRLAYPIYHESNDGCISINEDGLTKHEKTCIELGIPETGDSELNKVIRKAERRDVAKAAMQGIVKDHEGYHSWDDLSCDAVEIADALLKALED